MNIPVFIIELICFMASLTLFTRGTTSWYLKLFTGFLLITIVVESGSAKLEADGLNIIPIYNIFTAFEFEFYLLMIRFIVHSRRVKKIMLLLLFLYPVLVLLNVMFIQVGDFHTITYSLGCLLVVACSMYYFFEIFRLPTSVNLVREPAFWLCTALLFYYCCTFTLVGLWNQLEGLPQVILKNVRNILTILNFLLYSLFSIAFLCHIRIRKHAL